MKEDYEKKLSNKNIEIDKLHKILNSKPKIDKYKKGARCILTNHGLISGQGTSTEKSFKVDYELEIVSYTLNINYYYY